MIFKTLIKEPINTTIIYHDGQGLKKPRKSNRFLSLTWIPALLSHTHYAAL